MKYYLIDWREEEEEGGGGSSRFTGWSQADGFDLRTDRGENQRNRVQRDNGSFSVTCFISVLMAK